MFSQNDDPPHLPLAGIRPLERTVSWLLIAVGFALTTVVGAVGGFTNVAMCGFIIAFGGVEIYRLLRFLATLHEERQRCVMDYAELQRTDASAALRAADDEEASVLRKLVAAMAQLEAQQGEARPEPILDAFRADFEAITDRSRGGADLLATMGLLGTVVGLLSMFSQFEIAITAGDASQIGEGIRGSLSGLSTAFYTTLFGSFLGSFVLRGLADIADEVIDRLLSQLAAQSGYIVIGRPPLEVPARPVVTLNGRSA